MIMTIKEAIRSSKTMREAAHKLGMPFSSFKRKAGDLYKPNPGAKGTEKPYKGTNKRELWDILDGKHPDYQTNRLKNRLIKEGYMAQQCEWCGITDTYDGRPIILHLDHINGNNTDHKVKNLRLLCPNCHSQTDTWCGRNK